MTSKLNNFLTSISFKAIDQVPTLEIDKVILKTSTETFQAPDELVSSNEMHLCDLENRSKKHRIGFRLLP